METGLDLMWGNLTHLWEETFALTAVRNREQGKDRVKSCVTEESS